MLNEKDLTPKEQLEEAHVELRREEKLDVLKTAPASDEPRIAIEAKADGTTYELKSGVKFTRDYGNFNQDGSKLLTGFDQTYTEDKCGMGHDVCKIIGERNGKTLVQCIYCHQEFESLIN